MSWAEVYPWRAPEPGQPVIRTIHAQVRAAIRAGALKAGQRLPSSRDFARRLGVARASVVAAYDQLLAEGYAEGRPGSGTFVSADLSGLQEPAPASVAPGPPPAIPARVRDLDEVDLPRPAAQPSAFSNGRTLMDARALDAWGRSTRRALRRLGPEHFGYTDPRGDPALRAAVADYVRAARAVVCDPDQVLITAGAQHAVD